MEDMRGEEREHEKRLEKALGQMPSEAGLAEMGARFKLLGEASRLKILFVLAAGELCVEHISQAVGGKQSAVSHQLKILKDAKILKSRRDGQKILYSLSDGHVITMLDVAKEHLNCD